MIETLWRCAGFIMYLFISFIVIFINWIDAQKELSLNIKHAILTNIRTQFNFPDHLTNADIKRFVETVVQSSEGWEAPSNGTNYIMACNSAWNSTDGIDGCKTALSQKCIDQKTLLRLHSYPDYRLDATDTFPVLVYYLQNVTCRERRNENDADAIVHSTPEGLVWAYGIGFSILNCFISMVGGLLVPFMKRHVFQRILLYCVGLGVGTLASAGCLVLLPESLELFGTEYFKMAVLLAGIYLFYLSGRIKSHWKLARKTEEETMQMQVHVITTAETLRIIPEVPQPEQEICDLSEHVSAEEETVDNTDEHTVRSLEYGQESPKIWVHRPTCDIAVNGLLIVRKNSIYTLKTTKHVKRLSILNLFICLIEDEDNQQTDNKEVSTFAWMLLFGDAFHKFIDGVSVGASFTESIFTGFSVALAIVFEELPHELGDIAFLLRAGMGVKRALLYNLMAVIPSFIGVSLGIVLGENTHATTWILAIAGGMFIYISCVDMMPEMEKQAKEAIEKKTEKPCIVLLLQNIGLLTGFLIIFLLMLFGKDIEKSLITSP